MTTPLRNVILAALAALGIYFAAAALDREIGEIAPFVQGALFESDVEPEVSDIRLVKIGNFIAAVLVLLFFFGGLPIAVIAIVGEKNSRRRPQQESRGGAQTLFQACLVFQLVSIFLSGFWVVMNLAFLPLSGELRDGRAAVFVYAGSQLFVGLWALPSWRRLLQRAGETQLRDYFFRAPDSPRP